MIEAAEELGKSAGVSRACQILGVPRSRLRTAYRPSPYAINVCDVEGLHRVVVAGQPGHLYFGPTWSPDGEWLVYVDCLSEEDPAHSGADLCIGRPDGSEHRVVTSGQSHWFGAAYGTAEARGGGSNTSQWSPDGSTITYTRIVPGSHPDCEYHPELPDDQELVYRPALARGGTQLCLLDPHTGRITELAEHLRRLALGTISGSGMLASAS